MVSSNRRFGEDPDMKETDSEALAVVES